MKTKKTFSSIALLGVLLSGLNVFSGSTAQAVEDLSRMKESAARVSFVPRPDRPSPRRTQSGASRRELPGVCDGLPVLPESGLGLTTNSSPSLFVYFAKGTTVEKAILSLKSLDEAESEYYDTVVTLPKASFAENGGVVRFDMPEMDSALTAGQEYAWSLVLMCEGQLRPDSPVLSGSLIRVSDSELHVQEDASLLEKAVAYGADGVWYDLLSTLATIRSEDPNSAIFNEHWADVMASVGLDSIASEPLIME